MDRLKIERKNMVYLYKSEMKMLDKNTKLLSIVHRENNDVASAKRQINGLKKIRD